MNELPELLERALERPLQLEFADDHAARSWVFRAHNYIRRKAPHLAQLTVTRRGSRVRVYVPTFTVKEL